MKQSDQTFKELLLLGWETNMPMDSMLKKLHTNGYVHPDKYIVQQYWDMFDKERKKNG